MRGWFLVLLVLAPAAARAEVEGQLQRLVDWQESPLDLLVADPEQLAFLPGVDAGIAEAIVGLRELGELSQLDDLARVPGLGPAGVEAIRPYVRLGSPSGPRGLDWSTEVQARDRRGGTARHRFEVLHSAVSASGVLFDTALRGARASARAGGDDLALWVGHLRPSAVGGLFDLGTSRSRLAPASRPRSPAMRGRTDSSPEPGWVGAALSGPDAFGFVARGPDGRPAAGVAGDFAAGANRLHLATRVDGAAWALGADLVHRRAAWVGVTAERGVRSTRAGARLSGPGWGVGVDASATDGPLRTGSDTVTGHRLDRAHQVLQVHGRMRTRGLGVSGLWRELARARAAPVTTVELEAAWRAPASSVLDRVTARVRVAPQRRLTLEAGRATRTASWRLRFTQEAGSELVGAEWKIRRGGQEMRLTAVGVDGTSSRSWMYSRPHTGILPVWIRPPGLLCGVAWGLGGQAGRLGAWAWLRADAARRPSPGIGVFWSFRAGEVVRRLQGRARSGAVCAPDLAPSRRSTR
jgi:hypothetical protein